MKKFTDHINQISFEMLPVQGTQADKPFMMGDEVGVLHVDCKPVHPVLLSEIYMGRYPVTQALWRAVVETPLAGFEAELNPSPSDFKGEMRPVDTVSWEDIQLFLKKLNKLSQEEGVYRLPTEAEWEYAARGGMKSEGYCFAGSDKLNEVAWFEDNSDGQTHEVGLKMPNELGMYDMSGNVWEWCADLFDHNCYQNRLKKYEKEGMPELDPIELKNGMYRVIRGGSWSSSSVRCRSAYRFYRTPAYRWHDSGFRLVFAPQFGS